MSLRLGSDRGHKSSKSPASFPGLSGGAGGAAPGERPGDLLRAHARKVPFIFRIIRRKISENDVIVHGESARKEYADTACGGTEHI